MRMKITIKIGLIIKVKISVKKIWINRNCGWGDQPKMLLQPQIQIKLTNSQHKANGSVFIPKTTTTAIKEKKKKRQ